MGRQRLRELSSYLPPEPVHVAASDLWMLALAWAELLSAAPLPHQPTLAVTCQICQDEDREWRLTDYVDLSAHPTEARIIERMTRYDPAKRYSVEKLLQQPLLKSLEEVCVCVLFVCCVLCVVLYVCVHVLICVICRGFSHTIEIQLQTR